MWDLSSPITDWTCIPCIGMQTLNHWTSREVSPGSSSVWNPMEFLFVIHSELLQSIFHTIAKVILLKWKALVFSLCLSNLRWFPIRNVVQGSRISGCLPASCYSLCRWLLVPESESESESCSVVSDSLWPRGLYSPWNSLGQNTGVGSLSLLQGIFPTQGLNPGLPPCRQTGRFFTSWAMREVQEFWSG